MTGEQIGMLVMAITQLERNKTTTFFVHAVYRADNGAYTLALAHPGTETILIRSAEDIPLPLLAALPSTVVAAIRA